MEYLILLHPGSRAAEILTDMRGFPHSFTTYKAGWNVNPQEVKKEVTEEVRTGLPNTYKQVEDLFNQAPEDPGF